MQSTTLEEKQRIVQAVFGPPAQTDIGHLQAYLGVYEAFAKPRAHHTILQIDKPALRTHEDVINLVQTMKSNVCGNRKQLRDLMYPDQIAEDADDAIDLAVQTFIMVDASMKDRYSRGFQMDGFRPIKWEDTETLTEFVSRGFPQSQVWNHDVARECRASLRAWKLEKWACIKFRPTDNLLEHLLYDPQKNTLKIFHHTAFLKAHLEVSREQDVAIDFKESLQMGTLPPQLLLETLYSTQSILFPSTDAKSDRLLRDLVRSKDSNFDCDCLQYGHPRGEPLTYYYWGSRLDRIHELVTHPRPRHGLDQWLQRHTSDRNTLFLAIVGIFLSALFGFLSVVIGIVQTWIAYQQWKNAA